MSEVVSRDSRSTTKEAVAGGSLALGLLIGLLVETNTDDVARAKIATVQECITSVPDDGLSEEQVLCTSTGGSNGEGSISVNKLSVGDSAQDVELYIQGQESEDGIELDRMIYWGAAGTLELVLPTLAVMYVTD